MTMTNGIIIIGDDNVWWLDYEKIWDGRTTNKKYDKCWYVGYEQPKEIFGYERLKHDQIVCLFDNGM